jgi:carotenoid cleavage dioxygenase
MGLKNQFPFFPQRDDSPFDPVAAQGHVVRLSVDLADKLRPGYDMETLYPHNGVLSRQDDRYHSVAYDVGFMPTLDMTAPFDPRLAAALPFRPLNHWTRFDHSRRTATSWFVGPESGVQEACFVPRNATAPEGEGYLIGVVNRFLEMRNDLVVLDAQRLNEGPIATVRMPTRLPAQVHGWWVPGTAVPATRL